LRKPATTPTKVALDLELELDQPLYPSSGFFKSKQIIAPDSANSRRNHKRKRS
jgi:hypothetical protein